MKFMHRHRKLLSLFALVTFAFVGSATPAAAYYHPGLGRFLSRDPDGTAIVVTQGLPYRARNPVVTVTASGEVQYADGMSLYQFVRTNRINKGAVGRFGPWKAIVTIWKACRRSLPCRRSGLGR